MGNTQTFFSEEQLKHYHEECTFFSKNDIVRIYKKFQTLNPGRVPNVYSPNFQLKLQDLEGMKELMENPFKTRIYKVFSKDGSGNLNFDDFLDLHSVFNVQTPNGVKIAYLFQIYDFDEDCKLGKEDLKTVLDGITDGSLTDEEKNEFIEQVLQESDFDGDEALSFYEFEQILAKAPQFLYTLNIRI